MTDLDGAVLYSVNDCQTWNDFAGSKELDLKSIVRCLSDGFAHDLSATKERVERFRPACRHAPLDLRHRLRNRRRRDCAGDGTKPSGFDELTTFHPLSSLGFYPRTRPPILKTIAVLRPTMPD